MIRTKDPEYIANGGSEEEVIHCAGYILSANIGDKTKTIAQGEIYEDKVVFGIAKHIDHKELFMVAALGRIGSMKDTDD